MEKKKSQPDDFSMQKGKHQNQSESDWLGLFLSGKMYDELRQLSRRYMRAERPGHTLQPTEVVHEALARIKQGASNNITDAKHLYASAAKQMRWVLVEYARHRRRKIVKAQPHRSAEDEDPMAIGHSATPAEIKNDEMLLDLHEALEELEKQDVEAFRACELRYFGGHTVPKLAVILGVSPETVARRLRLGTAWLRTQLGPDSLRPDSNVR